MEPFTYKIAITGTVQGVGFRPFIYQIATEQKLRGSVCNNGSGVEIILTSSSKQLKFFLQTLQKNLPSLASIDTLAYEKTHSQTFDDFKIVFTQEHGKKSVLLPPDVSVCETCENELFDTGNRRYLYPFITCTHCGVRYSIIHDLPYDRKHTSMKFFEMCKRCKEEYANPLDRRFHAQPIGCWECGPALILEDNTKKSLLTQSNLVLDKAVEFLLDGKILALKGVGGYHLVCDATNDAAVLKMRHRKKRLSKPYALMVPSLQDAHEIAHINAQEKILLLSKERPIVLLNVKAVKYSKYVAPDLKRIGIFLPYTPIHLILLKKLNRPLVATSANISDEPICSDKESLYRLCHIYDYIVDHNREVVNACDDSIAMVVKQKTILLRRARGYAPVSIKLPCSLKQKVLSLGAHQKNTIAIGFEKEAILSPHIGDLNTLESIEYFTKNIQTLERIYDFRPDIVVHDKHPQYESTKYAQKHFKQRHEVQHHYAHILGVMAEKGIKEKVLGVAFDGTGYGDDGHLWGGEFLVCDYKHYERVAHFKYFKLLGGAKAIKEPKRVALSILFELYGKEAMHLDNSTIKAFTSAQLKTYYIAFEKDLNAPLSSSVGRIFDVVASLLGVCHEMSYEGESGMLLEGLYDAEISSIYPFEIDKNIIDFLPMISALLQEKVLTIAVSKFFNTLVSIIVSIHKQHQLPLILSGGVFQNSILLGLVLEQIPEAIIASEVPPNDGGIALGQIASQLDIL